jgi:hypothetical protein
MREIRCAARTGDRKYLISEMPPDTIEVGVHPFMLKRQESIEQKENNSYALAGLKYNVYIHMYVLVYRYTYNMLDLLYI